MRKIIEIKQNGPALYLTWVINNICTNQCSYCPSNLHDGKNHHYDWEHARRFTEFLLNKYPKIHLAISGGEPTVSPWFKDLVKMYSDAGNPVGVTTNGARTVRYYDDVSQYLSYVVMSYHPSFEDPDLLEKAVACSNHTFTTVSVMFDSRYFDRSLEIYHKIANEYPSLGVEAIRINDWGVGHTLGRDYTDEQNEILNSLKTVSAKTHVFPKNQGYIGATALYDDGVWEMLNAQDLINAGESKFKGWECNIGLESLFVHFNGKIQLGNCISSTVIGEIQNFDSIQWPTSPFICPQNFCNCTTDVYVSKKIR
jgi:organic radical activating enzyme